MYKIILDSVYSRIEPQLPANVNEKLKNELRYRPDGYQHTWNFKHKKWDGFNYLYDIRTQTFRTGLVWRVGVNLTREDIKYDIVDTRTPPIKNTDLANIDLGDIIPHQYQLDAANATTRSHSVIASPTGTGKTIIIALVIKLHQTRTLIVVNSRTLLDQTHEYLNDVVPGGCGIVGSGDFDLKEVTVATIQSIGTILRLGKKQEKISNKEEPLREWLKLVGTVIHDEVHEADSSSINALYSNLAASYFIGTTATPYAWATSSEKGKNLEMEQHFGVKVYDSRGIVDFIKIGINVPLLIRRINAVRVDAYKDYNDSGTSRGLEYRDVVTAQVIDNAERTRQIAELAKSMVINGCSCYVYYSQIRYGELLCEAMSDLNPEMLQGSTTRSIRNKLFKDINNKKKLLAVSDIGSYGLNIRSLDSIIIAYPMKDARQIKGRVCRSYPGKKFGIVIDMVDNVPFLSNHSKIRLSQYKKDKDTIIG